jgi:L-iditol 2-dehydrogenase
LLNGAYAEYLLVPERIVHQNLYHLAQQTSFIAAALTEPLACALHGVDASAIASGDTVVILGSGPLGLLLTALVRQKGARTIITGRSAERLALAHHFGADVVIEVSQMSTEEQVEVVLQETGARRGADVVIEAVGMPETWEMAVRLARPGGLVNFFGGCPSGSRICLETRPIHYSELTLKGVFHHTPAYCSQALELIEGHHIDVEALITSRLPLSSVLVAIELLVRKQGVKYALIPPAFQQALLPAGVPQ